MLEQRIAESCIRVTEQTTTTSYVVYLKPPETTTAVISDVIPRRTNDPTKLYSYPFQSTNVNIPVHVFNNSR